jgi:hypothetical protein
LPFFCAPFLFMPARFTICGGVKRFAFAFDFLPAFLRVAIALS